MKGAPGRAAALLIGIALATSLASAAPLRELEDAMIALEDEQGSTAPAVREARYEFAKALLDEGNHQDAAAQLRLVVFAYEEDTAAAAEDSLPARIDLGEALRGQGNHREAVGAYQGAIELAKDLKRTDGPRLADAWFGLGVSAAEAGECSLAVEAFDAAATRGPSPARQSEIETRSVGCLLLLAALERRARQPAKARAHIDRAIEIQTRQHGPDHPELAESLELAALILAEAGAVDQAKAKVREAVRLRTLVGNQNSPWVRAVKAIILDKAGNPKKAMQWLKVAAKEAADQDHPQRVRILQEFAGFLRRHGKKQAAARLEKKARELALGG